MKSFRRAGYRAMHLFWLLTRIPVSMNATACYFVNAASYLALPNVFAVGGSWVIPRIG